MPPAPQARSQNAAPSKNVDGVAEELMLLDSRARAVLYIVQCELNLTVQQVWPLLDRRYDDELDCGGGRKLVYFPNGSCMAQFRDATRCVQPTRLEVEIQVTKAGNKLADARKITSWDKATEQPLMRYRNVVELMPLSGGRGGCLLRRSICDFDQLQKQDTPLGEVVMLGVDGECTMLVRSCNGQKAKLPDDFIVFSAPATAELLHEASMGKTEKLQSLLQKRADPNYVCDVQGFRDEVTPLLAGLKANSEPVVRFLLESGGADPNVVCCRGVGSGSFYAALDVVAQDGAPAARLAPLILCRGGKLASNMGVPETPLPAGPVLGGTADARTFEQAILDLSRELQMIRRQPLEQQRASIRRLCLVWHPDKNRGREALATSVFQWLQQAALQAPRQAAGGVNWRMARPSGNRPAPKRPRGPVQTGTMSLEMRICCRHWSDELLGIIIEQGQTVHQVDEFGKTALFYAVRGVRDRSGKVADTAEVDFKNHDAGAYGGPSGRLVDADYDTLDVLVLDYGANVNACDRFELTPLMEAARYGFLHGCIRLLELNADPNRRNQKGHTAADIASLNAEQYMGYLDDGHEKEIKDFDEELQSEARNKIFSDRAECATYLRRFTRQLPDKNFSAPAITAKGAQNGAAVQGRSSPKAVAGSGGYAKAR